MRRYLFCMVVGCMALLSVNSAWAGLWGKAAPWWRQERAPQRVTLDPLIGPEASNNWTVVRGVLTRGRDEGSGQDLIVIEAGSTLVVDSAVPLTGEREFVMRFRLRPIGGGTAGKASLSVARKDDKDYGTTITVVPAARNDVQCIVQRKGIWLNDYNDKSLYTHLDWDPTQPASGGSVTTAFSWKLRPYEKILPGWPETYRAPIEHAMSRLPTRDQKWLEVRVTLKRGYICCWIDDHLAAHRADPEIGPDGFVRLEFTGGVELAGFRTGPVVETPGFFPVRLAGYVNGRVITDGASVQTNALPPAGALVRVRGVPFVFPGLNAEGNDHLDISRSLYRQANYVGYLPTTSARWYGSMYRDPARIQLRVPSERFDTLFLVAASEDKRDTLPMITAMFFKPERGYPKSFEARVPLATARRSHAEPLPAVLSNGKRIRLWLVTVPLDPGLISSFADMDCVEIELTKGVHLFRSYPDPISYSYHQGGLPSAVHVYAATLGLSPVVFKWDPKPFGHVWTDPDVPFYTATLVNRTAVDQRGTLLITTRSYDGTEETGQEKAVSVPAGETVAIPVAVPVKLHGYHDISATLAMAGKTWTETRSFTRLAPDTRSEKWTPGRGAQFGCCSYLGVHYQPRMQHQFRIMTAAGARATWSAVSKEIAEIPEVKKHFGRQACSVWGIGGQAWAAEENYDPAKKEAYEKEIVVNISNEFAAIPPAYRPDYHTFFPEPTISERLTHGSYPEYWNGEPYRYTANETNRFRFYYRSAEWGARVMRREFPDLKLLIPHGDGLFMVPLLRAGFPTELVDGCGLDNGGFERLPEMQLHQSATHRIYQLRKEFEKAGIPNPDLRFSEGIFVPTEPGACSWREQMDIYNRWSLINMAYGVKQFYSGWFLYDCGGMYGAEHYGGCGIIERIPHCSTKPGYAAFATMTDKLNEANYDSWLATGSLTTYALRFKGPRGNVYTLWTIRGKRPVTLTLDREAEVSVTDVMNNTRTVKSRERTVVVTVDPSVTYIGFPDGRGEITAVEAGTPDHSDTAPADGARLVADLGDGSWSFSPERDLRYEEGNFAIMRYPGKFGSQVTRDARHGAVLASRLVEQDTVRELMPWYAVLKPAKPVILPGAPAKLGLYVRGASDWGRVVYSLRDAEGERWISVGTKNDWNCDDIHSWSSFNFDGWRYVTFELPGHLGYDGFRRHGTTWWGSEGGPAESAGVVDLPLTLEKIIVEQRTHILYVNDVQPVSTHTVCFGKLYAEYADPADATDEAVRLSRLRMPIPEGLPDLPNPIADMERDGTGAPTAITKLVPPEREPDGTRAEVSFDPVEGAPKYSIWVAAHPDGRGAVNMTPTGATSGMLVTGLRPAIQLYYYVVYEDAQGRLSKPSPAFAGVLKDQFREK